MYIFTKKKDSLLALKSAFADDNLLYRTIADDSDALLLQKDLDTLQQWESINKMEFHPDKCSLLKITNRLHPVNHVYNIHNTPLQSAKSAKYLGVTIDDSLSWDSHIKNTYQKANFTLSFLERNLNKCPSHIKQQCYYSLVRPILDYGSCVWDPHLATQTQKLELINKRAARFATGNRTMVHGNTKLNMDNLGWCPLQERRAKLKVTLLYKILNNLSIVNKSDLIPTNSPRRPYCFLVPHSSKDPHLHSFFPSTIRLWNSLPLIIKNSTSLSGFKEAVDKHIITKSY